jgi:hypothetical protein
MPATLKLFKAIPRFPEGERKVLVKRWPDGEFAALSGDGKEAIGEVFVVKTPLTAFTIAVSDEGYLLSNDEGVVQAGKSLVEVLP